MESEAVMFNEPTAERRPIDSQRGDTYIHYKDTLNCESLWFRLAQVNMQIIVGIHVSNLALPYES